MVTIDDQANIVAMEGESLVSDVTEHSDGIVMVTEVTGEIVTPTDVTTFTVICFWLMIPNIHIRFLLDSIYP
jgi:hypothetical protein